MSELTLVLKDNKANNVTLIQYPDGQQSVKVDLDYYDAKTPIIIDCSIRNFKELETLICITEALYKNDRTVSRINFYYLFGMRSDRAFEAGQPNYFRDVLAPIINSLRSPIFYIFTPHSDAVRVIRNLVKETIEIFHPDFDRSIQISADRNTRARNILNNYSCSLHKKRINGEVVTLLPKIAEIKMREIFQEDFNSQILLFDDLCDGGATVISGAALLRKHFPDKRINLYVAHALFTKGIDHVADHFDHIYCTNSYQEISHPKVTQIKVF